MARINQLVKEFAPTLNRFGMMIRGLPPIKELSCKRCQVTKRGAEIVSVEAFKETTAYGNVSWPARVGIDQIQQIVPKVNALFGGTKLDIHEKDGIFSFDGARAYVGIDVVSDARRDPKETRGVNVAYLGKDEAFDKALIETVYFWTAQPEMDPSERKQLAGTVAAIASVFLKQL